MQISFCLRLALSLAAFCCCVSCQPKSVEVFRNQNVDISPILGKEIPDYAIRITDFLDPEVFDKCEYLADQFGSFRFYWRAGNAFSRIHVAVYLAPSVRDADSLFENERKARARWIDASRDKIRGDNRLCESLVVYQPAEIAAGSLRAPYYHSFVLCQKGRVVFRFWEQSSDWRNLKKSRAIARVAQGIKSRI